MITRMRARRSRRARTLRRVRVGSTQRHGTAFAPAGLGDDPRGLVPYAEACLLTISMGCGHGSCHDAVSAKEWAVDAAASGARVRALHSSCAAKFISCSSI